MNNSLKEISMGAGFLITSCIVGVVMLVFGYAIGIHNLEKQLDAQKEMLYVPTTKHQCLDGTQLGFDAYVKGKDGDTNYILHLAKTRNADSRTIAVAYSVYSEIVNINLVVAEAAKNFGFKQGDEMAVARARRDMSMEQCNTIE